MELVNLLQSTPVFFLSTVFVLGLMVGSFLNVVILRLPKMMERDWQAQCREYLEQESDTEAEPLSLSKPASTCPGCGHKIRFYENIPVISWLLLRGKCADCKTSISIRYPVIELVTALLSVIVAWHFGFGWQALAALVLTWALIALSVIDFDT
ncbi:MAG: prepilin peptidase, partial [Gammaproteobacteria bacterium]